MLKFVPSLRPINSARIVPTQPPGIDWNNPLAAGLIGAWLPGVTGGVDLAGTGPTLVAGANVAFGASQEGMALRSTNTDAGYSALASAPFTGWKSLTLYWRGVSQGNPAGSIAFLMVDYDDANDTPFQVVQMGINGAVTQIAYQWNTGGVNSSLLGSAGLPTVAAVTDVAATFSVNGTVFGYFNGAPNGSTSFGASAPNSTATSKIGVATYPGILSKNPNALTFCAYIWNRALIPSEILSLHDDPYSFFTNDAIIFPFPGSAAAIKFRKTLSVYGSGTGKRQSQAA